MQASRIMPLVTGGVALLATLVAGALAGGLVVAGSLLIASTTALISIVGLAATARLLRTTAPPPDSGVKMAIALSALKLPLVALGLWLAYSLCQGHYVLLGAAVMLVYFCAVWFLATARPT